MCAAPGVKNVGGLLPAISAAERGYGVKHAEVVLAHAAEGSAGNEWMTTVMSCSRSIVHEINRTATNPVGIDPRRNLRDGWS